MAKYSYGISKIKDYFIVSLDFQALGSSSFRDENAFSLAFLLPFLRETKRNQGEIFASASKLISKMQKTLSQKEERFDLLALFEYLLTFCHYYQKPVVLIIDETDSASNNQVFWDFLPQLRGYYLERDIKGTRTFHSVILAGVYDIKNLKRKLRFDEEHKWNSPWNIATDFDVDMSLSEDGIKGMLLEYEKEHHTGMQMCMLVCPLGSLPAGIKDAKVKKSCMTCLHGDT